MTATKRFLFLLAIVFSMNIQAQTKTAYMVADAHLDTQWDWDVITTITQYLPNTLNDNFALFNKYPNYIFNFEGAIKYMWFKEYYPDKYEQLKTYVANGKWHIAGGTLDANDIIVPSPESQFRNILIGQTFYKKEFGKKSNDIFLPDCFGFGYTLPTIMKHAGLIGFTTQKLSWGGIVTPFKFGTWQGVDGSKVLAAASAGDYGHKYDEDLSNNSELLSWANETSSKTDGKYPIAYRLYGTGDRGGSPDDKSANSVERGLKGTGPVKIISATSGQIFDDYNSKIDEFPLYDGELIMTQHGTGCYTSKTMMKLLNRKNELLADASERTAVIADWLGGLKYPANELNDAWIKFIWHQFHDDITGTSVPSAYTYSHNDEMIAQNKFSSVLNNAVGAAVRKLDTQVNGTAIVVYNPLSVDRTDVAEATIKVSEKTDFVRIFDKNNVEVPSQVIESTDNQVKFIFVASVKSVGYEVFDVRPATRAYTSDVNLKVSTNTIENSIYQVSLNANGDIGSIIDKSNGNKQLLTAPIRLAMFNNLSDFWPSWEITYATVSSNPRAYVSGAPEVKIVEQGPVRVTLKITRKQEKSTFVQYIRLTNSDTKRRIDVKNEVDWKSDKTLLKAVFPFAVSNTNATYDLGIGVIQRPNNSSNRYEVPAQQWADITNTDNAYGVSILNDCKYGWDKPLNNTLRLTLIHTPEVTDRYKYQGDQDLGFNEFTYSIYGHTSTCLNAESSLEASKLNQPLMAFEAPKHDGELGKSFSFVNVNTTQVALKALKKAENSNDYVVRFYETKGIAANDVKVKFAAKIVAAKELNAIEEEIGTATFSDSTLTINMTAFQPKTYSVQLESPASSKSSLDCQPIVLPYNSDAISLQTDMTNGNFDGKSNSYAGELLPDTLMTDGIKFKIGPTAAGKMNIVKCVRNKIAIPAGYSKLYILASSLNVNGISDDFKMNSNSHTLNIPYFSNFIGQATSYSFVGGDAILNSGYLKLDNVAWTGSHMHNGNSRKDMPYAFTYLFKFQLDIPVGATELELPNNTSIGIFAITAANNQNDDTKPAAEFKVIPRSEEPIPTPIFCGSLLSQSKAATASGQTNSSESPAMALDGNETSTKWCQNVAGPKWLSIDLGSPMSICEWRVKHGGFENESFITKDFTLQKMVGTQWVDVDVVTGNELNTTDRLVTPFVAQKLRLYITNSGSDNAARIYEFQLYGDNSTGLNNPIFSENVSLSVFPNPVSTSKINLKLSGFDTDNKVDISISDISGKDVYRLSTIAHPEVSLHLDKKMSDGLYFITVKGVRTSITNKFIISTK